MDAHHNLVLVAVGMALSNPHWTQVEGLRLQLARQISIHRQEVRGRLWYVLQDNARGRYYRFTPEAYLIIGLLDGRRTVGEVYEIASRKLGETAPGRDEVIRLLAQLYHADALQGQVVPDIEDLVGRGERARRAKLIQQMRTPLAIRIPLIDPDRFLDRTKLIGTLLFSRIGFAIWLAMTASALFLGAANWSELTGNLVDRVLAADNILLMLAAFVLSKTVHELGHGYALKKWRGTTNEMGIMFLVFIPIPYVEASSASALASKWQRATVGAAGMYFELLLAAVALFVWLHVEPGIVRSVAFNLILIASVSTLLFNGNPLLRFDGYYILSDALEIPNLGPRANKYFFYIIQKWILGIREVASPALAVGEAGWLFTFAVASFFYRLFVIVVIALFIAQKFFFVGILLALWTLFSVFVLPLLKGIRFLLISPVLFGVRTRSIAIATGIVGILGGALLTAPFPLTTHAEGVVWPPSEAEVTSGTSGFVKEIRGIPGAPVCSDCPLLVLDDPEIPLRIEIIEARRRALTARYQQERNTDLVRAQLTRKELEHLEERFQDIIRRRDELTVRSPSDGRFLLPAADDLTGRFIKRGETIGYVVKDDELIIRALISQDDIGLLRERIDSISVRVSGVPDWETNGVINTLVPTATNVLPSMALSTEGGGGVSLDPRATETPKTLDRYFELTISPTGEMRRILPGQRAYVRILHGTEPPAFQAWRRLRQLFLGELGV